MTHSPDTPTPAMSAETVPSEEFVLVPREPTHEMKEAGARENQGMYPIAIYRAMIAAAPAPTPSSAAKGGEAKAKAKQALYSLRFEGQPMSSMFSAEELGLIVDTVSAALSTPTEGPASQTGPDVEPGQGSWAKRRAQMEASQTEGMGGDAEAVERLVDDLARWMHGEVEWPDQYSGRSWPEHDDDTGARGHGGYVTLVHMDVVHEFRDIARRMVKGFRLERAAALTPPETAEAVPVASDPAPATDDRVEAVAAAMWKEEAREATPRGVWEARTLEAFRETDDGNRYRWKRFARAALATEVSR